MPAPGERAPLLGADSGSVQHGGGDEPAAEHPFSAPPHPASDEQRRTRPVGDQPHPISSGSYACLSPIIKDSPKEVQLATGPTNCSNLTGRSSHDGEEHLIMRLSGEPVVQQWQPFYISTDAILEHCGIGDLRTSQSGSLTTDMLMNLSRTNRTSLTSAGPLMHAVKVQIAKADGFVERQQALLATELQGHRRSTRVPNRAAQVKRAADEAGERLVLLDRFVRQNVLVIRFLAEREELSLQLMSSELLQARSLSKGVSVGLILALSDLYNDLRVAAAGGSGAKEWQPPTSFERSTTKYWVKKEDVVRLKTVIARHLPVLIVGRKPVGTRDSGIVDKDGFGIETDAHILDQDDSSNIASVYLDNSAMGSYHNRVARLEGAKLWRIRWYKDRDPQKECFFEQKTHHESWTSEDSVKERFSLPPQNVTGFMRGTWDAEKYFDMQVQTHSMTQKEAAKSTELARTIFSDLQAMQLRSMVSSRYRRTAFQLPTSNEVRLTLDSDLHFVDEDMQYEGTKWCREYSVGTMQKGPPVRFDFPFAVAEVKLQDAENPPQWVKDLLESGMLVRSERFSKYMTGCGVFFRGRLRQLPHFFDDYHLRAAVASFDAHAGEAAAAAAAPPPGSITGPGGVALNALGGVLGSSSPKMHKHASTARSMVHASTARSTNLATQPSANSPECTVTAPVPTPRPPGGSGSSAPILSAPPVRPHVLLKVEPKTFFANERTYIQWLGTASFLIGIAGGLMAVQDDDLAADGTDKSGNMARVSGYLLVGVSVLILLYAIRTFYRRNHMIQTKSTDRYDDVRGPVIIGAAVLLGGLTMFAASIIKNQQHSSTPATPLTYTVYNDSAMGCTNVALEYEPYSDITRLTFEPSDVMIDSGSMYVPSTSYVARVPVGGGKVAEVDFKMAGKPAAFAHDLDLEGITPSRKAGHALLVSENYGETGTSLVFEMELSTGEVVAQWVVPERVAGSTKGTEAIVVVPAEDAGLFGIPKTAGDAVLLAGDSQGIEVVSLLPPLATGGNGTVVWHNTVKTRIFQDFMGTLGLDNKIAAMAYQNGTLWLLFDNIPKLLVWDLRTGAARGAWDLPGDTKQWEGVWPVQTADGFDLWLTLDTPPQVWKLRFDLSSGFRPACARRRR